MADFGLNMYDDQRFWIRNAREEQKKSWDAILMGLRSDDNGLNEFLRIQEAINFWTKMSCEEWKQLVLLEKQAEEETKEVDFLNGQALIYNSGEENDTRISRDQNLHGNCTKINYYQMDLRMRLLNRWKKRHIVS